MMTPEKSTNQLMRQLMKELPDMDIEKEGEVWTLLNAIIDRAKLDVVEDAEKAIGKLRVFSL